MGADHPSLQGQPVTFTATVTPTVASGTVTFKDGATTIGTGTIASGVATLTTSSLGAGNHTITAVYGGDTKYAVSTSPVLAQTVLSNGTVTLRVVTGGGDGTFQFTSSAPTLASSVTTSGGAGQTGAVSLNPGTYAVAVTLPSGFGLTSVTCSDGDSTGNVGGKSASITLAPAEAVTCTFAAVNSAKKTTETIARFMARRNDLLLSNGPDTDRQIDRLIEYNQGAQQVGAGLASNATNPGEALSRLGGMMSRFEPGRLRSQIGQNSAIGPNFDTSGTYEPMTGGPAPFRFQGDSEGPLQLSFSMSLSQMRRFAAQGEATRLAEAAKDDGFALGGNKIPSITYRPSAFDIWIDAKYGSFSDNRTKSDLDGHFGVVYVGADYIVNRSLLVGAYVQFDKMRMTSAKDTSTIEGKGWMIGPYATLKLSENIYLQGRAAWGRSTNSVSPYMTYEDSFSTERWLVASTLKGRWNFGAWQFRPSASIAYIEDTSKSYTDSLGVVIPSIRSRLGQFKIGPEVSYRFVAPDGVLVEPRIGFETIYNFAGGVVIIDGVDSGPGGVRGKVEVGLKLQEQSGRSIDFSAGYDGIGSGGYRSVTGKAMIRMPLN